MTDTLAQVAGPPVWWPPFVAATATILVGAAALAVAYRQILNQRRLAKRRNTIDLIIKFETDATYQKAFAAFRRLATGEVTPDDFIGAKTEEQRAVRNDINAFLNYCELMCLSLRRGTIDREIFYQWWGTPLVEIWNFSIATIDRLREAGSGRRRFVNFEIVARHFARDLAKETTVVFKEPKIANNQPLMLRDGD